jgi:L-aspartate oxidase
MERMLLNHKFDFLVLGSGLAGLSTALYASKFGTVGLITKSNLDISSSYFAQGGIAVVLAKGDSFQSHYNDTLLAGAGLCNKEAVEILVSDGSKRVKELIEMGMEFDKVDGELGFGLEGAHSHNRVIHADGDATGRKIVEFYISEVIKKKNITIFENTSVFRLNVLDEICYGFSGFNYKTNEVINFTSSFTMLATGGASAIYNRTTNPKSSTGDGISLAYRAGATIANMEFVQFHPSSLVTETDDTYLISEAVRGEGAYLVNSANERFMLGKHEKAELAPRDFVAYEIYKEWQVPNNKVFLTLSHLDSEKIRERFSNINRELKKHNLDIATDLISVSPAAHYMIGGVKSGLSGETNISGLYVAGEVASTGVHGANRLASNSLLECLVFSQRAVDYSLKNKVIIDNKNIVEQSFVVNKLKEKNFVQLKNEIQQLMFNKVGIIRSKEALLKGELLLNKIESNFIFEDEEYYSFQLKSIIMLARLMITSALKREESRGAQKRSDFPETKDEFLFEIIQQKNCEIKFEKL